MYAVHVFGFLILCLYLTTELTSGARCYNATVLLSLFVCASGSELTLRNLSFANCAIRSACDRCGSNTKTITRYNIKVCCRSCSAQFDAYNLPRGRGYCNCYEERMKQIKIKGDCWQGIQCAKCGAYTGRINGIPVCCPNCEKSGMALSPTSCYCLHNGPKMSQ